MTGASLPPLGSCRLCGHRRHVSRHKSRRDELWRLLCTSCFSAATLAEERGGCIDWQQAAVGASDGDLLSWLQGEVAPGSASGEAGG